MYRSRCYGRIDDITHTVVKVNLLNWMNVFFLSRDPSRFVSCCKLVDRWLSLRNGRHSYSLHVHIKITWPEMKSQLYLLLNILQLSLGTVCQSLQTSQYEICKSYFSPFTLRRRVKRSLITSATRKKKTATDKIIWYLVSIHNFTSKSPTLGL